MMETMTINLFYPMLFTTIVIILVVLICAVKSGFQFKTHVDEHKDTTGKFSKAHTEVIDGLPIQYHKELHSLEVSVEDNRNKMQEIIQIVTDMNNKLDLAIERIIELEKQK